MDVKQKLLDAWLINKTQNFLLALLFSIIFYYSYVFFLNYYFEYLHFPLFKPTIGLLLISLLIAAMPIFLHKGFRNISSFISILVFILLYIPTIMTFTLALNEPIGEILSIQSIFLISMCLLFMADRFVLFHSKKYFHKFISFRFILILTTICSFYAIYIYWGNLKFVSFENVYVQRFANIDIGTDTISRYVTAWLSNLLIPLCLLYGILNKNSFYFIIGSASSVILYMTTASKGIILMPLILLGLYYLISKTRLEKLYSSIILFLCVTISGLLLIIQSQGMESFFSMAASILIMRIVATGGILNLIYYDYFLTHPHTYYTHIGPINTLTNAYPYGDIPIGQVIGQYYISNDMNANANFWATDGIASLGLIGVPIITLVLFFILILLNTITKGYNKIYLILLFIPFLGTLLNTSLFQTMWSGGGFFIIILLLFLKTDRIGDNLRLFKPHRLFLMDHKRERKVYSTPERNMKK